MNKLLDDLLIVALDSKESEHIRIEAMRTVQAMRPSKSTAVMSSKGSQLMLDNQMFDRTFEVCDFTDDRCQTHAAGTIAAMMYKVSGYEITRYRVKKLLLDRDCEVCDTGRYTVKLINKHG